MSASRRQLANSSRIRWPPVIHLVLLVRSHQSDLSSLFMTVGGAVTPWRPPFFRADGVGHGALEGPNAPEKLSISWRRVAISSRTRGHLSATSLC